MPAAQKELPFGPGIFHKPDSLLHGQSCGIAAKTVGLRLATRFAVRHKPGEQPPSKRGHMPVFESRSFPPGLLQSDILIVGAGAVGLAMAARLSRGGKRVTVLEGGPATPPADYAAANAGPSRGKLHSGLSTGRMKALGGTSRLWGGQLVPFTRRDIDARDSGGRRLWPVSWDAYQAHARTAFDFLGIEGAAQDLDGVLCEATGAAPDLGEGLELRMNVWLPQPDFTKLFAAELNGPLVSVITGCNAEMLDFASDGRVSGLLALGGDGAEHRFVAREVVLAGGTLEVARLLLRAGAEGGHCPFAANPHLGRWFFDHCHGRVGDLAGFDPAAVSRLFDSAFRHGFKYNIKIWRTPGEADPVHRPNVLLTINPAMTLGEVRRDGVALVKRLFSARGGAGGKLAAVREGLGMAAIIAPLAWRYLVHKRSASLTGRGVFVGTEIEQMPAEGSYLFLEPGVPPRQARLGIAWDFAPDASGKPAGVELAELSDMIGRANRVFPALGLGHIAADPGVEQGDPALLDRFVDAAHNMGGARMAESADFGVTDAQGCVFGCDNLSIGGASVFPCGSAANATFTAIAFALQVADRIGAGQMAQDRTASMTTLIDRLVFGCARLTGGASEREALALLDQAFAAGVRAVDVAPGYGIGTADTVVGKALRRHPAGDEVLVYAKIGSGRPSRGTLKTWARLAKRMLKGSSPRSHDAFVPIAATGRMGRIAFTPDSLEASHAETLRHLGRIDVLMIHECGPDDLDAGLTAKLDALAKADGAQAGTAVSCIYDAGVAAGYPAGYLCEAALPPQVLADAGAPVPPPGTVLHSVVPTMEWLRRTDPVFAARLDAAAALVTGVGPQAARMAATYSLAASRMPGVRLVFASADKARLAELLSAFAAIDREGLAGPIAEAFA